MHITSTFDPLPPDAVARAVRGLPSADGYDMHVKPLRYRDRPHLAAWTDFEARTITIQVPEPFFPFGEVVPFGAKRRPGPGMRFIWLTEGVTFRTPEEVVRFLYCHEWLHFAVSSDGPLAGRRAGETACDRFALRNFEKEVVTRADAEAALRRR